MKRSTSKKSKTRKDSKKLSSKKIRTHIRAKALPVLNPSVKKTELQVGGLNRELLRSFTEFMREEGLSSFSFKSKEFEVELKFGGNEVTSYLPVAQPSTSHASASSSHSSPGIERPDSFAANSHTEENRKVSANTRIIKSPFVGTFYRSAAPGKPSFVDVGTVVNSGDALCILEAMKLMNEIEAEYKCKIVKILVEDSSPVEYGESLFEVEAL